jgi:hypothetical protein
MRMITANCPLGPKLDQFQANVPTAGRIVDLLVMGINIVLLLSESLAGYKAPTISLVLV